MTDERWLVTGSRGQLASALRRVAPEFPEFQLVFAGRDILDVTDHAAVEAFFARERFAGIINGAAYTAVDRAEQERDTAESLNHHAVAQLARIAKTHDMALVHISTDYVFDGQQCRPYREDDPAAPQSAYGFSKWRGEQALLSAGLARAAIVRTAWLYDETGHNFVKTMLRLARERDRLGVVFDQVGTPTYARDLARALLRGLSQLSAGIEIYHYSNEGVCSWYDFALAIFEMRGIACPVTPIETQDYPTPAKRPAYSVLNKAKIKHAWGITIPHWREALRDCLQVLREA